MKIQLLVLTFFCMFFVQATFAQQLILKAPLQQEVEIGHNIHLSLSVEGIRKYRILMEGNPPSAVLKGKEFYWTPQPSEKKYYLIKFTLIDSASSVVDHAELSMTVMDPHKGPYLVFDRSMPDTIKLIENETFSFIASIRSRQNVDAGFLNTYFTFNENPNLRSFDSCSIAVAGDQLVFRWTPSNKEALQEYLKFRITIMDSDQSVTNQVLNFKIKNINQAPHFKLDIPDTIFLHDGQDIDYTAVDPDNDVLKYDYSPKSPAYALQDSRIIFYSENINPFLQDTNNTCHILLTVSDGKAMIKHSLTVIRNVNNRMAMNLSRQPVVGDFTKKIFSEGDSVLTYLNISNYPNLGELDINYVDLNLPPDIRSLAKHLIFEKMSSYIKIYSVGPLPYSLVDRNYNYNISLSISDKITNSLLAFKVLVLTVDDRPDPKNISQKRDSIKILINNFLRTEGTYQSTLGKVRNRINRPWWKKVALITGTLSGVLTLIQSEHSNKTLSAISASISLLSIMVTNLPGLSEKTLAQIDHAVSSSKAKTERLTDKVSEFNSEWFVDTDQDNFDRSKEVILDIMEQGTMKRKEDVCQLMGNKRIERKLHNLIRKDMGKNKNYKDLESIFKCDSTLSIINKPAEGKPRKFWEILK